MKFLKLWAPIALLGTSFSSIAAQSFTVTDIRIEGLQRVALGAALLNTPVKVGDVVNDSDIARIIKSLYRSTNFENIQVYEDNGLLIIKVKERPTIFSVNFDGNKVTFRVKTDTGFYSEEFTIGDEKKIRLGTLFDRGNYYQISSPAFRWGDKIRTKSETIAPDNYEGSLSRLPEALDYEIDLNECTVTSYSGA